MGDSGRTPPLIPPYQGGIAVVPLIRGSPPKGGGGFAVIPLTRGSTPEGGEGLLLGESSCFPIGKKTPLNPPLSGGQKALPLRGRLASLSGMETPLIREVFAVVPLIRGIPPKGGGGFAVVPLRASTSRKGGRGFCRCPPDKGDTPEGGRGFVFRASGRKPPLIPPYQGVLPLSP